LHNVKIYTPRKLVRRIEEMGQKKYFLFII